MTQQVPDGSTQLDHDGMHIVMDGKASAPALLLLGNPAAPTAMWDPVVPSLTSVSA